MPSRLELASGFAALKKQLGITDPKLKILSDLSRHGRSSYGQLTARCDINPKTIVRYTKELRAAALIQRDTNAGDIRVAWFSLSDSGKAALKQLSLALGGKSK